MTQLRDRLFAQPGPPEPRIARSVTTSQRNARTDYVSLRSPRGPNSFVNRGAFQRYLHEWGLERRDHLEATTAILCEDMRHGKGRW